MSTAHTAKYYSQYIAYCDKQLRELERTLMWEPDNADIVHRIDRIESRRLHHAAKLLSLWASAPKDTWKG